MKRLFRKLGALVLILLLLTGLAACSTNTDMYGTTVVVTGLDYDGTYTTAEDVAAYIFQYGELPGNFMTKDEARELGWEGGGLDDYAYGMCIGGDKFGNYEGYLPEADGRRYFECDINTLHKEKRGAERIVYSNDGLIYYTPDHYETFELLYGEE